MVTPADSLSTSMPPHPEQIPLGNDNSLAGLMGKGDASRGYASSGRGPQIGMLDPVRQTVLLLGLLLITFTDYDCETPDACNPAESPQSCRPH